VLCLCFRFEDETQAIFRKLLGANDWSVITFLDHAGNVIASSDVWQVPLHAKLEMVMEDEGRITRFGGREYLTISRHTQGYQGYQGPGWVAHVMVPLANAFEQSSSQLLSAIDKTLLADAQQHATIFSEQLRTIPKQADHIQRELTKSVWNGNVNLVSHDGKENSFSKSLLREISATGRRTKEVFEQSIGDLHETVISAVLHDARFRASLAVEIMDRNLYERANDCRWWALNDTLRSCLASEGNAEDTTANATQVLHKINQLYTVYDNIILFNRDCRVVAISNSKRNKLLGTQLSQAWARETLTLRDSQAFGVSLFEAFPGYNNQHCYIFTAAIHGTDHRILGGIAIVFDSAPQFSAMLHDVLPLAANGSIAAGYDALLIDHDGKVISATNHYQPGDKPDLPASLLSPPAEGIFDIAMVNGHYCAVGTRHCSGYREFKGTGATAIVIRSLGEKQKDTIRSAHSLKFTHRHNKGNDTIDLAVVSCGEHWLAIPSECVVEAIDDSMITRVPGRAPWFSGVTRYQSKMLPVVDLSQWISSDSGNHHKARAIVVIQEGGDMIGLAIDHLGDVLTVAKDEIVTMDTLNVNARTQLTPQVVRPRSADDSALLLLDVSALAAMLNPGKQARSA
jgi:chemotaxis signal transduction protein